MSTGGGCAWTVQVRRGKEEFRWKRLDGNIVAEWVGVLVLHLDERGNVLEMAPDRSAPRAAVDKIATGVARAFARSITGAPSLHASGIAFDGRAVACLGPSGVGKSTLASALSSRDGFSLIADDVVCLDRLDGSWRVLPAEQALWLADPQTPGAKRSLVPRALQHFPAKLAGLVRLRFSGDRAQTTMTRLKQVDALAALTESLLRFEATADRWKAEFDLVASLVDCTPVYELSRPRQLSRAAESEQAIWRLLAVTS